MVTKILKHVKYVCNTFLYIISIRDYGRGIPLGKVEDCASKINTGGKYDTNAFKKSVGLNGVGIKAVNALSSTFRIHSIRDKKMIELEAWFWFYD